MTAFNEAGTAASGSGKSSHAYRNARQSVLFLDHARRSGLKRTFAAGIERIGEVEAAIRSYRPDPSEAAEYADALRLIGQMKVEAGRV